jgi:hypothetical protein
MSGMMLGVASPAEIAERLARYRRLRRDIEGTWLARLRHAS